MNLLSSPKPACLGERPHLLELRILLARTNRRRKWQRKWEEWKQRTESLADWNGGSGKRSDGIVRTSLAQSSSIILTCGVSFITCPTELIKIRQQSSIAKIAPTTLGTLRHILRQDGVTGLYRGFGSTAGRELAYGTYFFTVRYCSVPPAIPANIASSMKVFADISEIKGGGTNHRHRDQSTIPPMRRIARSTTH